MLEELADGETSAERIVRAAIERAQDLGGDLHAFVSVIVEPAIAAARGFDARRRNGERLPVLAGVPWAVKDVVDVAGCVTRAGSRTTEARAPAAADAAVVAEIADLGAVLVGKTSTNELAYGGPSRDVDFPMALNPAGRDRFTGGSSSGSAAAVAAGIVPFAIGTDTGGSVRGPAAWTGCIGVKPTIGALPSSGVMALAGSLDHVGFLTRTVDDADVVWSALCGEPPQRPLGPTLAGFRIGFLSGDWVGADADQAVRGAVDHAAHVVDALDAELVDVEMPDFAEFAAVGRVLIMAEAWETHAATMRHHPERFGEATRGRLLLGATITAADKALASRSRRHLATATCAAFEHVDVIVTPTAVAEPPLLADVVTPRPRSEPPCEPFSLIGSTSPMRTIPFNLTGHPAVSVPAGRTESNLPVGLQVVGRPWGERDALRVARAIEYHGGEVLDV